MYLNFYRLAFNQPLLDESSQSPLKQPRPAIFLSLQAYGLAVFVKNLLYDWCDLLLQLLQLRVGDRPTVLKDRLAQFRESTQQRLEL